MTTVSRTSIAFNIVPGKKVSLDAPADIRLSQAALNDVLVDKTRSSLKLSYWSGLSLDEEDEDDDEEEVDLEKEEKLHSVTIANFIPGVVETQLLGGLIINSGEKVTFEATGKNSIHVSGNVILQEPQFPSDDELDDDEEQYEELDDDEVAGMGDVEKEAFLKELSRSDAMQLDADGEAKEVKEQEQPSAKKHKKDKKKTEKEQPPKEKTKEKGKEKPSTKQTEATPATTTPKTSAVAESKKRKEVKEKSAAAKQPEAAATTSTPTAAATATTKTQEGSKKRKEIESSPSSSKTKDKEGKAKKNKGEKKDKEEGAPPDAKKAKRDDAKKPETTATRGGVKIADHKPGDGPGAKPNQTLSMRYILKLANGKVIDKNTSGKPFKFQLGAGEVIKGWDEGLVGMKVGGERTLEVPPNMGYGKRSSNDIPANSTLFFEVKLLDIGK